MFLGEISDLETPCCRQGAADHHPNKGPAELKPQLSVASRIKQGTMKHFRAARCDVAAAALEKCNHSLRADSHASYSDAAHSLRADLRCPAADVLRQDQRRRSWAAEGRMCLVVRLEAQEVSLPRFNTLSVHKSTRSLSLPSSAPGSDHSIPRSFNPLHANLQPLIMQHFLTPPHAPQASPLPMPTTTTPSPPPSCTRCFPCSPPPPIYTSKGLTAC